MVNTATSELVTGQWFDSKGEKPWWFDSGSIAIDFANTGALPDNLEQFHAPANLGSWLNERLHSIDLDVSERELSDALGLRSAIASLALCSVRGHFVDAADIDILNLFAAMPDIPPALDGGSRRAGASRVRTQQALSSIAREAIRILHRHNTGGDTSARIRQCSADDCDLVYLDTSRSGNRRWCSMQRCGNRAKVRAHRARAGR